MSRKSDVAKLSVASNTLLIVLKLAVGITTGAVSVISEVLHSMMDLIAAVIAYISVKISGRPPDATHPYGHEKIENISSVIETVLIFIASLLIIKQAVVKLMHHTHVVDAGLGFGVMAVSAIVNFFVSRKLYAVAREEESVAIEADALHLKADVYTSLGVAAGLLILWVTGLQILDPIIAILIALFIMKEAGEMLMVSFGPLMDAQLSEQELGKIQHIMERYRKEGVDFHELRTRRSGNIKHIDLHMTTPFKMTVAECHELCDNIEQDIEANIQHTRVLIHAEPCKNDCAGCSLVRDSRRCPGQ